MRQDDLRRAPRVRVCCRVLVRERHGVWTAVTDDIGARGCSIVTPKLPRLGSRLTMTLSSDLFDDELDVIAETVWATTERLGVLYVDPVMRDGALSPPQWLEAVIEHGLVSGPGQLASHVTPVVLRAHPRQGALTHARDTMVAREAQLQLRATGSRQQRVLVRIAGPVGADDERGISG